MTTPLEMTIEEYKEKIKLLMDSGSDLTIGNRDDKHAAALYELFFNSAKKEVRSFCENLKPAVFEDRGVLTSITNALTRGVKLKFLVQKREDWQPAFATRFENNPFLEIKHGKLNSSKEINFCVMDDKAYRFEKNRNECQAFAKMNAKDEAETLAKAFDGMWENP